MTRKTLKATVMAIACLCMAAMAQPFLPASLPKLEITTSTSGAACPAQTNCFPPPCPAQPAGSICLGNQTSCSGGGTWYCASGGNHAGGGEFPYRKIESFKLTVPGNTLLNVTRTASDEDSIRGRGNSSASGGTSGGARPYRVKLGSKEGLFGREPNRSWVLLSTPFDESKAMNAVAFELGRRVGLAGTPTVQFVELHLKIGNEQMQRQGVYMLTDQVQVNKGRVDIDEEEGWLAEIDYHRPDASECNSWFSVGSSDKCAPFFIKSPEDKTRQEYQFVRDDITALVNAVNNNDAATWRNLLDLESAAKYLLVQMFMANDDFQSPAGGPGSNFIHKDKCHSRIYSGPLWDLDASVGYYSNGQCSGFAMGCPKFNNTSITMEPGFPFWKTIWNDAAFRAALKEVWTEHKSQFQSINTFATQLQNHIGSSDGVNGNYIGQLATWLSGRYTYADGVISQFPDNYPAGFTKQSPEPPCTGDNNGPFTLTLSVNPTAGGRVYVKVGDAAEQLYSNAVVIPVNNTPVTVRAEANEGYTFTEWGGALTTNMENQKTNMSMTWGISSNRSLIANFRNESDPPTCAANQFALTVNVNGDGTVTRNPDQDCYNNNMSVTLTATASSGSSFTNWTGDGLSGGVTTSTSNPLTLSMTRARAVTANFGITSSVGNMSASVLSRTRATLRADARVVYAMLPANHGYTSYRLFDLQGREIRSGRIEAGMTDLRFDNVRVGVVLLKLEGKKGATTLRATAVR